MIITYHGHSCFKLKGKNGTVVTDPYSDNVGFSPPNLTADIITVSHQHEDHNATKKVKPSSRRDKSFVIDTVGEYEVGGISVFGSVTYHDDKKGEERGSNNTFVVLLDEIRICHLGDLGHELTEKQLAEIGQIDILLVPVGGVFTIDPQQAVRVAHALNPNIVIPMHFKTPDHNQDVFGELKTVDDFIKEYGAEVEPTLKLSIEKDRLPEEMELVVLHRT